MANLKDGIESLVKEATKESKPAVKNNPVEKAKADYNKGKISMGQMDDVAIREFEKKQKSAPKLTPAEEGEKAARQENAENFAKALKNVKRTPAEEGILQAKQDARENKKPAPWKYTPFKLDTKKYADVKQTPYGYIYNVGNKSITDLNAQNRHFAKNDPSFKFDENKDYGFSVTNDSGDETYHDTWDKAYNTARGGSEIKSDADLIADNLNKTQPKSYGSKEDGYEGSPMKEFSGPEGSDLSYAQLDAKHGDVKNAPFVVDADGEKFAFDTEREADSFIERNKYSYSSLKKHPQPAMSKAESFLKTNNNLNQRIKEEGINTNLLISKLDNYHTTADVRSIVNGDVGNFNGLSNGEIMDILDSLGYDYELRPSKTGYGKTIYYIPRKK